MTRRTWLFKSIKAIVGVFLILLLGFIMIIAMAPIMLALGFTLLFRLVGGFLLGLIYPPWGQKIIPDDNFGMNDWFGRSIDWMCDNVFDRLMAPVEKLL
jgi:hypothetical protein